MTTLPPISPTIFQYLLRLGDDSLVYGHRLSQWCSHGPTLEEDLALSNLAIDCLGHARILLELAAAAEGKSRTADDLCYFREASEYRNLLLLEIPDRHDFAHCVAKQFIYNSYHILFLRELIKSSLPCLSAFAEKALKEVTYHLRHSHHWVLRLGDGTTESQGRMQNALEQLWIYTDELFHQDALEQELSQSGIGVHRPLLRESWLKNVADVLHQAKLLVPNVSRQVTGGWEGRHTEHLGVMLAEMQVVARSFPGAHW